MKVVRKMVIANVAILIDKENPERCGNQPEGDMCRFLNDFDDTCVLYAKSLKIDRKVEGTPFMRCKQCLAAEPVKK